MPRPKKKSGLKPATPAFDARTFLDFPNCEDRCLPPVGVVSLKATLHSVMAIRKARSGSGARITGKKTIVAMLGPHDFLGRGVCGQSVRMGTATAISATSVLVVPKKQMINSATNRPFPAGSSKHNSPQHRMKKTS